MTESTPTQGNAPPPSDRFVIVQQVLQEDPADHIEQRRMSETARDHTGGPLSYRDIAADINVRLADAGIPIRVSHEAVRNWHQARYPDRPMHLKKGRSGFGGGHAPEPSRAPVETPAETVKRLRRLIKQANEASAPPPAIFQAPDDAA